MLAWCLPEQGSVEISNGGAGLDGDLFHNENLPKDARENKSVLEMKLEYIAYSGKLAVNQYHAFLVAIRRKDLTENGEIVATNNT